MRPVCETCGDQGWKGLLVTCTKCRIASAHRYCMEKNPFETSTDFVCAECSERLVKKRLAAESIKAAPRIQKSKARVESSNPVPRWKKIPESSKMKLISPEEVRKISSGAGGNKSTFKVPRPVPPRSPMGLSKFACFPRSMSLNSTVVAHKTNQTLLSPKKVVPLSPRTLQIRSGAIQQSSKAQAVVEGSKSKAGAKDFGSKRICRSILSERLLQLLPYRPALHPIWKGRIVDSATPSEFNGEFYAHTASEIRAKAYNLSKTIPVLLKVELVPIGNLLNDLFVNRNPALSDVEMYIFPDDKNTKRCKEEHVYLFETIKRRNAMIRINIKDTPLLIFSSKFLDNSSQIIIEKQNKTNNFLWGIFLVTKKSLALVPGTSNQAQRFDNGDVVDNDTKHQFRFTNHRKSGKQLQRRYRERV